MKTMEELRHLPKTLLIDLYKTAQTIGYDDLMALHRVRDELGSYFPDIPAAAWCHFTQDMLYREEARLQAKLQQGAEWMNLLDAAIGDRRPALVRILFDNLYSEPWPKALPLRSDGPGPPQILDLGDE